MDTTDQRAADVTVPTLVRRALQRCATHYEHARADAAPHPRRQHRPRRAHRRTLRPGEPLVRSAAPLGLQPEGHRADRVRTGRDPGRVLRDGSDARFWADNAAYHRARLEGLDHDQTEIGAWST